MLLALEVSWLYVTLIIINIIIITLTMRAHNELCMRTEEGLSIYKKLQN